MKGWKDMRPIVRRAVELTGGRAEFKDRHAPTWDGRCWHFARTRAELHVIHEVAHWLAFPKGRQYPNYGLGKDPDGGPSTGLDAALVLFPGLPRLANEMSGVDTAELIRGALSWEEEIATVLTCRLAADLGFSGWKGEANRTHLLDTRNWWKIWCIADTLQERGVDVYDPIPGLRASGIPKAPAQGQGGEAP